MADSVECPPSAGAAPGLPFRPTSSVLLHGVQMSDLIYIVLTLAVFTLIGLAAKGVGRL